MVVRSPVRSPVASPVRSVFGGDLSVSLQALLNYGATDAWDFVADQYIRAGTVGPSGLTVTRASSGYAETASGTLVNFGSNVLRRTDKGVLVEGARTNLLLRSQEFETTWTRAGLLDFGAGSTVNAAVAPDGTMTAELVTENTDNSSHTTAQFSGGVADNTAYTLSVFVKPAAGTRVFWLESRTKTPTFPQGYFDLQAGTVLAQNLCTATITPLANGWYRCAISVSSSATGTFSVGAIFGMSTGSTPASRTYTGDGTSGIFLWGAQLEAGAFPSSYIPTVASTVTRAADQVTASLSGVAYPLSLYAEFVRNGDTGAAEGVLQVDASSRAQRANINISSTDTLSVTARGGTDNGDAAVTGAISVGAITKGAGRIELNKVQAARGGSLATEDTTASVPTSSPDTVRFGDFSGTATYGFNYIRRAAIFNAGLSDASLQGVTS
jgi:hypothetical protein